MTLSIFEIVLIAVALGFDAFAVGLGVGTTCCAPRQVFRLSFHFGLFQFMMPLIGWLLGRYILVWAETWGSWIAFGLLLFIGARMVRQGVIPAEEETECVDRHYGQRHDLVGYENRKSTVSKIRSPYGNYWWPDSDWYRI